MRGQHALLLNGDTRHTLEKSESTPGTTSLMSSIAGTRLRNGLTAFNRRSKLVTATLHAELTHRAFVLLRTNDHDFFVFAPQDDDLGAGAPRNTPQKM